MKIFINENILTSGQDWIPSDQKEIEDNLNHLLESLYCLNFYLEPSIYYTATGITKIFDNLKALESLTDYSLSNPIHRFRTILNEIGAVNWEEIKRQRSDQLYFYLIGGGGSSFSVNSTSIAEAAEYTFEGDVVALLNILSSDFKDTNPLSITRSDVNPPNKIHICPLTIIVSEYDTIQFVLKNRTPRVYNWNKKHGQNGVGMIANKGEEVSPLECNIQEATDLLPLAVGYRKTNELYAYDKVKGKFMVFKDDNNSENNSNSYHSYHPIKQNEVNIEVQKYLLRQKKNNNG